MPEAAKCLIRMKNEERSLDLTLITCDGESWSEAVACRWFIRMANGEKSVKKMKVEIRNYILYTCKDLALPMLISHVQVNDLTRSFAMSILEFST